MIRIFKITRRMIKQRKTLGNSTECYTCRVKIKVGDSVVTKPANQSLLKIIRHESCARMVNLI